MTLGTGSISPLEMAAAYATFANGGYYRQPIAITEIDSRTGSVLYQHTDNRSKLTEGEAAAVTDVLSGVMQGSGTALPAP
ncbi:MAG: penicillin-binding transpeptidase domain-containing protein [Collinsella aerofaciens]